MTRLELIETPLWGKSGTVERPHVVVTFDPGPVAITLAAEIMAAQPNIKVVHFLTNGAINCMDGQDKRGRWDLPTGTIFIDLGECVRQLEFIGKGMFITYNIWYNVIYSMYHEAYHANQCHEEGWVDSLPADANVELMESEAHDFALQAVIDWFANHKIPTISEMGDLGQQIKDLRNYLYATDDQHVVDEQKVWGTNAAGLADDVIARMRETFTDNGVDTLIERIDQGLFGCVFNGVRYLKAEEIIAD
jgi:hypothetical protein